MRSRIPTASRARRLPTRPVLLSLAMVASLGVLSCSTPSDPGERLKSLSQLPNRDQSLVKLGDSSRDAGDCVTAVRFYRLAIDKDSEPTELASARLGLGTCELGLGDLANAETDYREAAKLMPANPAPMLGLGRLYLVDHKPGEAVAALDAATKTGATGPSPWNDKGVALDQLNRHGEAQLTYRTGLGRYPGDRALQSNLGLSLAMSGDLAQAETLLAPLAAGPTATARNRQNLALVLGLKGEDVQARDLARRDLDGAAVDNNMRYYQRIRSEMTGRPTPPSPTPPMESSGVRAAPTTPVAASALAPVASMEPISVPKTKTAATVKTPAPKLAQAAPPMGPKPVDAKPIDLKPIDLKPVDIKPADTKPTDAKVADAKVADTKVPDTGAPDTKTTAVLEVAPYAAEEAAPQRPAASPADENLAAIPPDATRPAAPPTTTAPATVTPPALASAGPAPRPPGPVASSEDQPASRAPLIATTVAAVPAEIVASP